ncbi:MAG TPA: hypothetical protein VGO11_26130 [Chthoniobacteraceae bacterium]|jgi:hypothetical protein|nr:hypothetical protein [Chthoniobacteraceae bacterium]
MKNIPGLFRLPALTLAFAACAVFTGCTGNGVSAKPEVHGKMGVQVESRNTRGIRPVPPQ